MTTFSMAAWKKAKKILLFFAALSIGLQAVAEQPKAGSSMSNPFVVIMVIVILILALIIGLLANLVLGAAFALEKKEKETIENTVPKAAHTAVLIGLLLVMFVPGHAQENTLASAAATNMMNGVSPEAFYLITGIIFLELLVVFALLYNLKLLIKAQTREEVAVQPEIVKKPRISWWDKLNKFRPVEQEVDIDLGHNYDGIRELDNRLPPWWLYGFYATILFAGIYLWRFHIAHTAPLSGEEFQIAMHDAALQREAYLKKAANNIDENNVKYLSSESDLASGKNVFETTCLPCHGKLGEGGVGPNLTDDFWLHGGSMQDIFKTIKYGWPEKGMKSWKDDYSPSQLAQLSSYIKSLHGTNPPNGKTAQGVLYQEKPEMQKTGADSTAKQTDSAQKSASQ